MSITNNNTIAKIAAVIAGLGLVAMSFASFAPAKAADSTADLNAQIASLLAQIQSLQSQLGTSSTTTASVTFSKDLTLGSTGSDVTALQNWLIGKGYAIAAGATGYFGAQTQSALAKYQVAVGITPASGYFGPITRAKVGAVGGTTTTTTTTTTTGTTGLTGAGRLTNLGTSGDVESDLDEGDSATAVLGVEAEAKDGDVSVQRVDVDVEIKGDGSSSISKYISEVGLYLGDKKLATMDATDGDKDGKVWSYRFADLSGVIKEGDTDTLYVKVTPVESIGTSEAGDTVRVTIPNDGIRAVAADGISETYVSSGSTGYYEDFTVSTAELGKSTVSEGSDNPDTSVVKVDADNTTTDVTLVAFNVKAKNQDITIHDLPVTITAAGTYADVSEMVQTVKLMDGSKVLKSKSVSTSASSTEIVFDNIDQDISKDDTVNYTVVATLKSQSGNYSNGYTLVANVVGNDSDWDVEDSNGDAATLGGSAIGGTLTLQTGGFNVAAESTNADVTQSATNADAYGTFTLKFKVTANDDDAVYITKSAATSTAAGAGYNILKNGTVFTTGLDSKSEQLTSTAKLTGSVYKIEAGATETFTLTTTIDPLTSTGSGQYAIELASVRYSTNSDGTTSATTFSVDTNNADYETDPIYVTAD